MVKVYWIIFTNQTLNSDTLIRLSYAHYIVSLITLFLVFIMVYEMHYDWKNIILSDNIQFEFSWLFIYLKIDYLDFWNFNNYIRIIHLSTHTMKH